MTELTEALADLRASMAGLLRTTLRAQDGHPNPDGLHWRADPEGTPVFYYKASPLPDPRTGESWRVEDLEP